MNDYDKHQTQLPDEQIFCRRSEIFGCKDYKCKWNYVNKRAWITKYKCKIMHCKEDRKEI